MTDVGRDILYQLEIMTAGAGLVHAWVEYDALRRLARSLSDRQLPAVPAHVIGGAPDRTIRTLDTFLAAALVDPCSNWRLSLDAHRVLHKYRHDVVFVREPPCRPSAASESPVVTLQAPAMTELPLVSLRIAGSRVVDGRFAVYLIAVATAAGETLVVWHRFRALRAFAMALRRAHPRECHQLPPLPPRVLFGRLGAARIASRAAQFDAFLHALVQLETLSWAWDIDDRTRVARRPAQTHCIVLRRGLTPDNLENSY
ncbi:hypothetical protein ACHHYP_06174 [Achlya hypogyna]|uniref:PX domain-containing protein n=1 Tax=Achlya hypogyna TaxID=1202772 RepID=A0A1V9YV66_ACHHY|nr:hypothetical protein ACHHYP_06174 [Achlya hypogyna]